MDDKEYCARRAVYALFAGLGEQPSPGAARLPSRLTLRRKLGRQGFAPIPR